MEPAVRARYTSEVRDQVARVVGVAPEDLEDLGGFESFVHVADVQGTRRIVKATWHARRSLEELGAEHHFVTALGDAGAPVCRPLPLATGRLVESVPAGDGYFHVMAYEHAEGQRLTREHWTPDLFVTWGSVVGMLHHVATDYEGPPSPLRRPTWEHEHADVMGMLTDDRVRSALAQLLDRIRALPKERGSFGPMHTDLHSHNVHWSGGQPRVFDFDDMLDFWFVSDLAIVLYYAVIRPIWHAGDKQADYEQAKAALLTGYGKHHDLPEHVWATLPLFLQLREITLLAVCERSYPVADRPPELAADMEAARERILEGRSPHDLEQL